MDLILLLVVLSIPIGLFLAILSRWKEPPAARPIPPPESPGVPVSTEDLVRMSRAVASSTSGCVTGEGAGFTFVRRGLAGSLDFGVGKTVIRIDTRHLIQEEMRVEPVGFLSSLFASGNEDRLRLLGSREEFDRLFKTRADEQILKEIGVEYDLRMGPKGMIFRIRSLPGSAAALGYGLACAFRIADLIPGIETVTEMEVGSVTSRIADDTSCQVCGSTLAQGAVVRCERCSTPHHEDCWTYARACSTFGCRSDRFLR